MGSHSCAGSESLTAEMSLTPMNLSTSAGVQDAGRIAITAPLQNPDKDSELALFRLFTVDLDGLRGFVKSRGC